MNYKLLSFYFLIIVAAQFVAWYQSNSLLLWDWLKNNYIPVVVCTSPVVGLCFAYGTKVGRFSAFAIGYLVFIFLAWYHLGESPFSPKNIVTSLLCFSLLGVQVFWK